MRKIVSFGYRHKATPRVTGGVQVIDVRQLFTRNPFHNPALRKLPGTDPLVQQDILRTPNFSVLYEHLKTQVQAPGTEVVYLGCTGGHHRSVFLAERLGKDLGVEVEHRDLDKP